MSEASETPSDADLIVHDAFDKFQTTITSEDFIIFQGTTLQNVKVSARDLENKLAPRIKIPNTARLERLFAGLQRYNEAAADFLLDAGQASLMWAPVRLTLEITAEHSYALDQVIAAYKNFGNKIPSFDKLTRGFRASSEFQHVLAVYFAVIVEFHRQVYQLLRKPGWQTFFESFWDKLQRQFKVMLQGLSKFNLLLQNKPESHDIEDAFLQLQEDLKDAQRLTESESNIEFTNVQKWLEASNLDQDDILYDLQSRCHEDSCNWIFDHAKIKSWISTGVAHSILWLKGKPGSGKSVLSGKLLQGLQSSGDMAMIYYFCNEALPETKKCHSLLRSLIQQLIQKQPDLAAYVQKKYVNQYLKSSVTHLREILQTLPVAFKLVRVIVDGMDECQQKEQKLMLNALLALTSSDASRRTCKILISSQDIASISVYLQERSTIDLSMSGERKAVQAAISTFVHAKISQRPFFRKVRDLGESSLKRAEQALVDKADGMFLWVELVIALLERAYSSQEVQQALDDLPSGLEKVQVPYTNGIYDAPLTSISSYVRIFERMKEQAGEAPDDDKHTRIFQWLTCSRRQLRKYEIQCAATLHPGNLTVNDETRVDEQVFEVCKPLVENSTGEIVRFVHITVKDFLLKQPSQSAIFNLSDAKFTAAFSCLTYLNDAGVHLIDDDHSDDESRLVEIGKGFHGLCQYACRYWVEHLLTYLESVQNTSSKSKQDILSIGASLAHTLSSITGSECLTYDVEKLKKLEKQAKVDRRAKLLENHGSLHSLVLSTLEALLSEKISPRVNQTTSVESTKQYPIRMIQRKYEKLVAQLLKANSVEGLTARSLTSFKKTYSMCVLVCRFADCPRELHGFDTVAERDAHEATHKQVYRCPHPECSLHRIGLPNNKKLQQHLQQFHPEPEEFPSIPAIKPFGGYRVATDATLVEMPTNTKSVDHVSEQSNSEEEEEEAADEDESDVSYSKGYNFAVTDTFALRTARWVG